MSYNSLLVGSELASQVVDGLNVDNTNREREKGVAGPSFPLVIAIQRLDWCEEPLYYHAKQT